jgi:hypothetical protein
MSDFLLYLVLLYLDAIVLHPDLSGKPSTSNNVDPENRLVFYGLTAIRRIDKKKGNLFRLPFLISTTD